METSADLAEFGREAHEIALLASLKCQETFGFRHMTIAFFGKRVPLIYTQAQGIAVRKEPRSEHDCHRLMFRKAGFKLFHQTSEILAKLVSENR